MPAREVPPGAHVTYSRQFRRCTRASCTTCRPGRPGHGPYWYAYWRENGRLRSRYLGKTAPREAVAPSKVEESIAPTLRVRTLGGFEVWRGDAAIPASAWTRRSAAALFTCLIGQAHQRAPREYLQEILWPEGDPVAGARKLRAALYHLRRALDDPQQGARYVRTDGDVVALVAAPGALPPERWLDASAFEGAARSALEKPEVASCRAALALYTGDYLPEHLYDEWAAARRETLRGLYLALLLELAALRERDGVAGEATRCLRAALAVDPCHEPAARSLMRLQAAAGHQTEALRTYRRLADVLERELALAPDSQTQALYAAVQAERATPIAARTNLPTPITSFQGRRRDLATLAALLCHDPDGSGSPSTAGQRLVTLTGPGGCGKTRLAIELGHEVVRAFADGVWLVELAALSEPTLLGPELCQALGIAEEPRRGVTATLNAALGTRHLLIILDNCEHLLDGCARLTAGLLGACPRLHIVATSREALGIPGEVVWPMAGLAVGYPDAAQDGPASESAAMRLFVERGRAVRPGFALTPTNQRTVAEVCYRLDGMPLAIELAAARLATLPVEHIAARLDDRFALLSTGNRAAPARQQTLQATLDWSYSLLDATAQMLLRRLAVFRGGWTQEAAEAVGTAGALAADAVRDMLSQLVAKSLAIVDDGDRPRWRMLETVGHYAWGRLVESAEEADARAAHARHFLAMAEQAASHLGGREQAACLDRLETEHANLRAALRWAQESRNIELGLRLAGALARFWEIRGHLGEGRRWLEELLAAADLESRAELAVARATALHGAGLLAWRQGDHVRAVAFDEACLALRREQGDRQGIAATLNNLANVAIRRGEHARAAAFLEESLALAREIGDSGRIAAALSNLGVVLTGQGDYARASALFAESLAIQRERGASDGIAIALSNQGYVAWHQRDYAHATSLLNESLALRRELGDKGGIAIALSNLGEVACLQGDLTRAATVQAQSLALFQDLGETWGVVYGLERMGLAAQTQGPACHERAVCLLGAAAAWREKGGFPLLPNERARVEPALAALGAAIGAAAFQTAWADGQAMAEDEAIAYALDTARSIAPHDM